ncbi:MULTISPECIES: DUF6276 family protein [Haloferacaceae]|uniref:DUF6276 family protein n=1 Tax=Halorubrum glutamatedens TaxID=2707018 RepID=A0ABD5QM42_9EURY|nr:DUF6276 family protein [Halobellus captivus]
MACPHCSSSVVAFPVPSELRDHAPADEAAICTRCLRVAPAVDAGIDSIPDGPPDLAAVDPAFPDGDAGIALALLCGHLESFALSRASIEALVEHAERGGADVLAFLERLDAPDAAFDLDRRRTALLDLL